MKKQTVVIGIILVVIALVAILIKSGIVSTTEIIGKQQNYMQEQKEPIKIEIEQNIEKYLELENEQVLLQQKIVVNTDQEELLQIKVPTLQEKTPKTIGILANGTQLENQYYNYDAQNMQLNIETTKNIETYKIIYIYQETKLEQEQIELSTKAVTKEIETTDEKEITLEQVGEKVSVQGEITKEVYKGYLYEAKENETTYNENYIIEISNLENVEEINLEQENEIYTYGKNETKTEIPTNGSTYFKQTIINKDQMLDILGEDGTITILNNQNETIELLTKDSEQDENGNIVINYENKETKEIKILTDEPKKIGEIKIQNKKAIDSKIEYSKQEIEQFENLESTIKANESIYTMQMKLQNTITRSKNQHGKNRTISNSK